MIERIKFWWNLKRDFPFIYIQISGEGYATVRYNPITDNVFVRRSRHGYVIGDYDGDPLSREFFMNWYNNNLTEWAKAA